MKKIDALSDDIRALIVPLEVSAPIEAVYFLMYRDKVQYVGQTENLLSRVESHRRDKHFDRVLYIDTRGISVSRRHVESALIRELLPPLNVVGKNGLDIGTKWDEALLRKFAVEARRAA